MRRTIVRHQPGWLGQLRLWLRGRWPDHNPLRRGSDRVESAAIVVALALFLIGAPVLALLASHWAYGAARQVARDQQATWRQVPAVLLANAEPSVDIGYGGVILPEVRARWVAPDGRMRTGDVPAPVDSQAGRTVRIWVNAAGWPSDPPLHSDQVTGQAILAAVLAPLGLGVFLLAAESVLAWVLDRRRMAAWSADWQATAPRWTSYR
jgi:hypothetical protein